MLKNRRANLIGHTFRHIGLLARVIEEMIEEKTQRKTTTCIQNTDNGHKHNIILRIEEEGGK